MIKFTATARVHFITPAIQVTENFQKRELILDDSWTKDGKTYPSFVAIEFTGDKMFLLDNFIPGQTVTVEAFVNGREHQGRFFNTIRGQSIALYQAPQPAQLTAQPTAQPMSAAYPQQQYAPQAAYPQQQYAPQAAYPQQSPYPQPQYPSQTTAYPPQPAYPQAPAPMPAAPAGGNLGPNGLPF